MLQPYNFIDENGKAVFIADNQAVYKAFFLHVPFHEEPQLEGLIVDFSFERDTTSCADTKSRATDGSFRKYLGPTDERIAATLQQVVNTFFENNPDHVVYFACDSADNKHMGRLKMFNEWYAAHQEQFTKIEFCIGSVSHLSGTDEQLPVVVGGAIFLKATRCTR